MNLRDDTGAFVNALRVAANELQIPERLLEKDYWVTEVLRALFASHEGQLLFKGGTSLSKGWKLIDRFSEDIDLLLLTEPGESTDLLLDSLVATSSAGDYVETSRGVFGKRTCTTGGTSVSKTVQC